MFGKYPILKTHSEGRKGFPCVTSRRRSDFPTEQTFIVKQSWVVVRHARGSRKWIPRSDPMDLDLRSYGIIDPYSSFCREIHEIIDLSMHFFGGSTEIIDPMYTFYVRSTGIIDPDKKRPRGIKQIHRRKGKLKPLGCIHKNNINCSNYSKQCPEVVPTAKCQLYK